MTRPRAPRRTAEQWQTLIDQWQDSNLSAQAFCDDQGIGYASFCAWRRRLMKAAPEPKPEASFIDLGALAAGAPAFGWNIVLSLGNGVELRLSQH